MDKKPMTKAEVIKRIEQLERDLADNHAQESWILRELEPLKECLESGIQDYQIVM